MTENKLMDDLHRRMLRTYHALCTRLGLTADARAAMLEAYGVTSSRDLDTHDLVDLCARLSSECCQTKADHELDTLRKRCMAAIGAYLRRMGAAEGVAIIKGIACRIAGKERFNQIPRERLRSIIYTFRDKVKTIERTEEVLSHPILVEGCVINIHQPKPNNNGN